MDLHKPNNVCKLNKVLYELKQAPQVWFTKLSTALLQRGFCISKVDTSMFVYQQHQDMLVVLVYVDDIFVTCSGNLLIQ